MEMVTISKKEYERLRKAAGVDFSTTQESQTTSHKKKEPAQKPEKTLRQLFEEVWNDPVAMRQVRKLACS